MNVSILINQLIVVGIRKNYTVNFNAGVNIIYGDIATGKSSILNLIDYLLGAKKFNSYREIESAARYAVLDVELNNVRYTIKREIFDEKRLIEVYQCSFNEIEKYPCKKYIPSFSQSHFSEEYKFFSEFLFDALNLTSLKIKVSPSKDGSSRSRLSFRDMIKYCYIDQDDLGSKRFLDRGDYVLEAKHSEVFKYIFNALDSQIADVEQEIALKTQKKSAIEKQYQSVSEFLRESDFGSMQGIDEEITRVDEQVVEIKKQIVEINSRAIADNEMYRAIKSALEELELEVRKKEHVISEHEVKIEQFTRLKNDYLQDISKFNSSLEAQKIIGEIPNDIQLCPVCDNTLRVEEAKSKFEIPNAEKINQEINSLKRRVRDVESLVNEHRKSWELESVRLKDLIKHKSEVRQTFDIQTKDILSPYISERDTFISKKASLEQKRNELVSRLKIRNQHSLLDKNRAALETEITSLKEKLEKLRSEAPSLTKITSSMADNLKDYLSYVNIKDHSGISLNKKFFPMVRDTEYQNITSGGIRTITCIGYLCSFLRESLITEMNYPAFLMIDTVGKYLGKTQDKYRDETSANADYLEGVSDPSKYQNIFEYIINLSEQFESKQKICQIILVDNDVPQLIIDKLSDFTVAHFSSERRNGLPVGFIDDADLQ